MSSGGAGNNTGNNNSGNNNNSGLNLTRRQMLGGGAAVGGAAAAGGLGALLWPREIEIDGYETNQDFETHREVINHWNQEFSSLEKDYKETINDSELDNLLEDGEDIRVGIDGETSIGQNQGVGLGEDVLENPEYILSQSDDAKIPALVSTESSDDLSEQMFTEFNSWEINVDNVLEGMEFATDSQKKAAKNAARSASEYSVFAATGLDDEQPIARPSALEDLKKRISNENGTGVLDRLEDTYDQVVKGTTSVDNYENELATALGEAKEEKGLFDSIESKGRAEDLLADTREVLGKSEDIHGYSDLSESMAEDIARYRVIDSMVNQAHDRAEAIWESSGYDEMFVDLDMTVQGNQVAEGIKLGQVDNWSDIDDETIGSGNYLQSVANDLDGMSADEAGEMVYTVVQHDGRTEGLFVNPDDHSDYKVSDISNDQLVYDDIRDGSWDGGEASV
ncbi:hypothetical protein GKQ38_05095 [Candidatus Nanohaloarchaea archaeon]|nr:hypothetical protein GKQ38_05095 [Candidatus Nanohaloarchaea archaeon]